MAVTYISDLVLYTGTDFDQTFSLEDYTSNSVLDLTGYTGCAQMRRYEASKKTVDFQVIILELQIIFLVSEARKGFHFSVGQMGLQPFACSRVHDVV